LIISAFNKMWILLKESILASAALIRASLIAFWMDAFRRSVWFEKSLFNS